jgi:broad specificity phosphatase PhoE
MSILILVRHGQASFLAEDYDQLSEVGRTQAGLLGRYWARRGLAFDEVYTGPRHRQRQTAALVGACFQGNGAGWAEPVVLPELDEYDLRGIFHRLAPELALQDQNFADAMARFRQSSEELGRGRNFQKAFEMLTGHWQTAADSLSGMETWPAFRSRVQNCIRRLLDKPGRGRRVVLFTSGGFIGTAIQMALAAPDRAALETSWRIRNGSLNEFVFTRDRLTLDSFNAVPHLESPELWTYR